MGEVDRAGFCVFSDAALLDDRAAAAWGPLGTVPRDDEAVAADDIGEVSGGVYGDDTTGAGKTTWQVRAVEGFADADARAVAVRTSDGRHPALMVGHKFIAWWPADPGVDPGMNTYELLLADGRTRLVRR
ncbi:MAG: hypothetical protein V9G19_17430 [Tetrasphaera sp.]